MTFKPRATTKTREEFAEIALGLALEHGLMPTRDCIAAAAECPTGTVSFICGRMSDLRAAVMRLAVERGHAGIVLQGLAARCPIAMAAPHELKMRALNLTE